MATNSSERLAELVNPALAELGFVIEDITVMPAGKRRLVRVLVERNTEVTEEMTERTEPISLDDVADATRAINDILDDSDFMGEAPYTLEVSSPGTDRPLTSPRHYVRNIGRLVALTVDDDETVTGRIVSAGPESVTIDVQQGGGKAGSVKTSQETFNYTSITGAKVQVEFTRSEDERVGEDA